MGTTTFYLRYNDFGRKVSSMNKSELKKFDELSPYKEENDLLGWRVPLELHNGNVYPLIFWKGRFMKLEDAPRNLKNKYYNKFTGKTIKKYEWTVLKKFLIYEVERLDKEFKKSLRKQKGEQNEKKQER